MQNVLFHPDDAPEDILVAVSERGNAPPKTESPTAYLARRFATRLGVSEIPIVRATQVHGNRVVVVEAPEQ